MENKIIQFGSPNSNAIHRKTVIVVLFNEIQKDFIYCDWPNYGLCCLVSGGLEDNESYKDAAIREIKEETGYYDCDVLGKLGGDIHTYYYMAKKDEFRMKEIQAYLVVINQGKKVESTLEEDEEFAIKSTSFEKLLELMRGYKNTDGTGLEDHIEILQRAQRELISLGKL